MKLDTPETCACCGSDDLSEYGDDILFGCCNACEARFYDSAGQVEWSDGEGVRAAAHAEAMTPDCFGSIGY